MDRDEWVDGLARWAETYGDPEEWAQKAKAAHARAEKAEARVQVLEKALKEAADTMQDLLGYVSPFFIEKWGYDEDLATARAALASEGTPEEAK